jgi:hypothetical protein
LLIHSACLYVLPLSPVTATGDHMFTSAIGVFLSVSNEALDVYTVVQGC